MVITNYNSRHRTSSEVHLYSYFTQRILERQHDAVWRTRKCISMPLFAAACIFVMSTTVVIAARQSGCYDSDENCGMGKAVAISAAAAQTLSGLILVICCAGFFYVRRQTNSDNNRV